MRITRIYIEATDLSSNQEHVIGGQAAIHIAKVLRYKVQQPLIVFNGKGAEYQAIITAINKNQVTIKTTTAIISNKESPLKIHLGQGISRGEKMDLVIQKAVELGVASITPLITDHCGIKLSNERQINREHHWQKIVISAAEQCGRSFLPQIDNIMSISEWSKNLPAITCKIMLDPKASIAIKEIPPPPQNLAVLIGPEGGFSDLEIKTQQQLNFNIVKIGERILRTETAAISAISILQYQFGDLN